jgi:serine/threonine-protein kinase HipA
MMISEPREVFVWTWLPGEVEPVVAGRIVAEGTRYDFAYGRSYLSRKNAIPLYLPELPLQTGLQAPFGPLDMANCLRDGLPDRWGRRVIINRLTGRKGADTADVELSDLVYMLESGSDRIGALDFQASATEYVARGGGTATLDDLAEFAGNVEAGKPVPAQLEQAILHGSSIGGARPKALLDDDGRKLIVKFSASNDVISMVKAEFIAMRLAARIGVNVAPVELAQALDKEALIVERFDRVPSTRGWTRRAMVSALTILGESEMSAHHLSYGELADQIRARFTRPDETLRELFLRLVLNILVGNTDDHARNHAAFWDGDMLTLTPAYDIAPQVRAAHEANQAMIIANGDRRARLETCLNAAEKFLLREGEARDMINNVVDVIRREWMDVCDEAGLPEVERRAFAGRQFFNAYAFEGFGPVPTLE